MSAPRLGRRVVGGAVVLLGVVATWAPRADAAWLPGTGRTPARAHSMTGQAARPAPTPAGAVAARAVAAHPLSADLQVVPQRQQRMDGFGVSGAWWPTNVGQFPASAQQELGELLFSPTGLAVAQYRYNIGGGGVGVTDPYKAPPSFLTRTGTYDWSADPNGLAFLQMAASYGVPQLIGFVNSAPAQFTTDGKSCGGVLRPDRINAYAAYLAQVVAHLGTADHIQLSYVSPMNEPDTSQPTCRQEGMAVPVSERAAVVDALARDLDALPGRPRVIADESSLVRQLVTEEPRWLPAARGAVAVIAHHTYDYPDQATLAELNRLPVSHWATEICCYDGSDFGWQYDPTMTSGLWLARTILGDLGAARDSAFDWWVAASPNVGCSPGRSAGCQDRVNPAGRNDGLVYYDPSWKTDGNDTLYLTKRYWVLASFSRYVRPGAVVHQVAGLPAGVQALAFEEGRHWSVVLANGSSTRSTQAVIHLPSRVVAATTHAYVTDDRADLAPLPTGTVDGAVTLSLPPRSVTTVTLDASGIAPSTVRSSTRAATHSTPHTTRTTARPVSRTTSRSAATTR